jgi:TonB family protein
MKTMRGQSSLAIVPIIIALVVAYSVPAAGAASDRSERLAMHLKRVRDTAAERGLVLDVDVPPKVVKQQAPKYPKGSPGASTRGTVLIMITIDSDGNVPDAEVLESVPALDAAALECVRDWRFKPAMIKGEPVSTLALVPVTFRN